MKITPREIAVHFKRLAAGFSVLVITGPRQSGKTTAARALFPHLPYVSLEDPDTRLFAQNDPRAFLERYPNGAIFDEVQRTPDLLSYLQTVVDAQPAAPKGRFILTSSSQFNLLQSITQSLAGRAGLARLLPLAWNEASALAPGVISKLNLDETLWRGSFPGALLNEIDPRDFFASYISTYVERDVRQIINVQQLGTFQRFIRLCAARVGQLLNLSSLAADCGISQPTAHAWLEVLETAHVIFTVAPYHRNFGKRLVKTPKLYFVDTGMAAWLLGIASLDAMKIHAMRGALFENFVVLEIIKHRYNHGNLRPVYFWRDSNGREIDLLLDDDEKLLGIEIKSGATFAEDWPRELLAWRQVVGAANSHLPLVIWGGQDSGERLGVNTLAWHEIEHLPRAIQALLGR